MGDFLNLTWHLQITPNLALGGNSAIESVASFANALNRGLKRHSNEKLDLSTLSQIFEEYESERKPRIKKVNDISALMTRLQAWDGIVMKFVARWILPLISDARVADQFAELVKAGCKLDYVPVTFKPQGTVQWDDEKIEPAPTAGKTSFSSFWRIVAIIVSSSTITLSYFLFQPRSLVAA